MIRRNLVWAFFVAWLAWRLLVEPVAAVRDGAAGDALAVGVMIGAPAGLALEWGRDDMADAMIPRLPRCSSCGWTYTSPANAATHPLLCSGRRDGGVGRAPTAAATVVERAPVAWPAPPSGRLAPPVGVPRREPGRARQRSQLRSALVARSLRASDRSIWSRHRLLSAGTLIGRGPGPHTLPRIPAPHIH